MSFFHDAKVLCSCVSKWVSCYTQDRNINVFCHLVFFASMAGDNLYAVESNTYYQWPFLSVALVPPNRTALFPMSWSLKVPSPFPASLVKVNTSRKLVLS